MSDDKLPEIPSFDDLGISPEELAELEKELEGEGEGEAAGDPEVEALVGASVAQDRGPSEGDQSPPEPPPPGKEEPPKAPPAEAVPPPFGGWRGPLTLVFLVILAWSASVFRAAPGPVSANAPDSVFSSARAMTHLIEIARVPHPPGSPEHDRVREFLLQELRDLGFDPSVQTTTSAIGRSGFVQAATVRNIVARRDGTAPTGTVLVTAHYDTRELAPGAGDDGSGVVAILEALRALNVGEPLTNNLIVLITDAEEMGLLGARAFVNEHPWMDEVTLVISIEMRGGSGPSIMFETGAENGWVVRAMDAADPSAMGNSIAVEVYKRLPNDTDFTPFLEAGRIGLNFAGAASPNQYHQASDSPENFSERTLQHHGVHTLSMLRHFGNADLSDVRAPDLVYFTVPILGFVTYGTMWIWVLGALGLVLFLAAIMLVRRGGGRWGGIVVGVVAGLVIPAAAAALAHFLVQWRIPAHAEAGSLSAGLFHSEGWYVLTVVAGSFFVSTLLLGLLRRWFSVGELAAGALVPPLVLASVATVMVPMGAMNVQWPFLGAALSVIAVSGVGVPVRANVLRWVIGLIGAAVVMVFMAPFTEMIWLAMGLGLAPVLGILVGLLLIQLIPVLDVLGEPNPWWSPVLALVLGGAFLGMGMMASNPSPDRPAPSTLVYTLDHETGLGLWATDPVAVEAPLSAGMTWAQERTGTDLSEPRPLQVLEGVPTFGPPIEYSTVAGPAVSARVPDVAVRTDSASAPGTVRVAVRTNIGAEGLTFFVPENGPALVSLNGKAVPGDEAIRVVNHYGTPEDAVLLDFAGAGGRTLEFTILETLYRPGELLGEEPFRRPPEIAPNVRTGSDRALLRTPVTIEPDGTVLVAGQAGVSSIPSGVAGDAADQDSADAEATEDQEADSAAAGSAPDSLAASPDTAQPGAAADTSGVAPPSGPR